MRRLAALSAAALIVVLAGCAPAPAAGGAPSDSTLACPAVPNDTGPRDCAEYDPDQSMELNQRYKEQARISEETREKLVADLTPVHEALEVLPEPPTSKAVARVFTDLGLGPDIQTDDNGNAVRFGVAVGGGCLTGYVGYDGYVEVGYGGYIKDGGCLVMYGH